VRPARPHFVLPADERQYGTTDEVRRFACWALPDPLHHRRWSGNEAHNNHIVPDNAEVLVRHGPRDIGTDIPPVDAAPADDTLATIKDARVRRAMQLSTGLRAPAEERSLGRRGSLAAPASGEPGS
jgi:hypothetical protein